MCAKKSTTGKEPLVRGSAAVGSKNPQYLGGKQIVRVTKYTVNGKELNNVKLADGTAKILNDKDLVAQTTDEAGDIVH